MTRYLKATGGPLNDWPQVEDADGTLIARIYGPNARSNAALFAAAPELLRQLKAVVAQLQDARWNVPPGIRDAIAAAEGR
jgi:hypothetical protein